MGRLIEKEIKVWIDGGVPGGQIAVLTANQIDSCKRSYENISDLCKKGFLHNGYKKDELAQDRPTLTSIERFKGLEADGVVLVVPTNSEEEYWKIHYVGVSRARQFLTVVKVPIDPGPFKNHLESELERLVENMTNEQIEKCGNVQGDDGTREIPAEIRTTILAKMKALNNREECEQNDSDKRYAFNYFWEIFHNRDIDLLKRLVENMTDEQIEKCCDIPVVGEYGEREIPEDIRPTIDNTMSESNNINNEQAYKLFWKTFDEANYERVLESELERLVENMTNEQIEKCCDIPIDERDQRFSKKGPIKKIRDRIVEIVGSLNNIDNEQAYKLFWKTFDEANYEKVLESELERLVENMTNEQIETCDNVQGSDGREIPVEICTTILARMKVLNDKEEQDHNDEASAFEYFWTVFDKRSEFLKNLKSELERLVENMTNEQIETCDNVQQPQKRTRKQKRKETQKQREIPVEICTTILARMKVLNDKEEQDHNDEASAFEYFWTVFDKRSEFLKNLKSELERLVKEMTYKQIETCDNVQGNDGMREIPVEKISTMILAKMKALNDKEEPDDNDKVFAYKYFWTIFDEQFSALMKNLKSKKSKLEDLVQEMTYEEYYKMNNVQVKEDCTRKIPSEIYKKISKTVGRSVLKEKENQQIVYEYFWTIFDEVGKPIIRAKFYYNIRKRLLLMMRRISR